MSDDPLESALLEPLSATEREILVLLAEGLSDKEIGARLISSVNTVKWHNRHIYEKLGVRGRKKAVQRALTLGLLRDDSAAERTRHNLPAQVTSFVGRSAELEALKQLLSSDHPRLVTLLAPGGMGKTRLAIKTAEVVLDLFPDGVYFAPLAPLTSHEQLTSAISDAVGCPQFNDERTPIQRLCDFLRRKTVLILLDNFEHLLEGVGVVTDVLQSAPSVKILVTSRERLNLSIESVYPVGGLDYPETDEVADMSDSGAVRLFRDAAVRANSRFAEPATSIVRVCRLVQGMPLALELAAAWAGALSTAEIAAEIASSVDFLQTTMHDVPERMRSIRAVFESAWGRLSDAEQRVFAAMSVFRGGCTREAAIAVTGARPELLVSLIAKALLSRSADTGRYEIHELLRQYAAERLEDSSEAEIVRAAHQAYFAAYTETWAERLKYDQMNALERLDADFDNVRIAFERAIAAGTPDALLPFSFVWYYFSIRGRWHDGLILVESAIDVLRGADSVALAKMLIGALELQNDLRIIKRSQFDMAQAAYEILLRLGSGPELPLALFSYAFEFNGSDQLRYETLCDQCHALTLQYEDDWVLCKLCIAMSITSIRYGRLDEAEVQLREAERSAARLNNPLNSAWLDIQLGWLEYARVNVDESRRIFARALTVSRHHNFLDITSLALCGLTSVAYQSGDLQTMLSFAEECIANERNLGREFLMAYVLLNFAIAYEELDEVDAAIRHTRDALACKTNRFGKLCGLRMAGILLVRVGAYNDAAVVLSYVVEQLDYVSCGPRERARAEAALETSRTALAAGRLAAVAEATVVHTRDSILAFAIEAL